MLCHWDEVPEQRVDAGHLRGRWTDLGSAAGTVSVGLRRVRLAPGDQSTPAHLHDAEEEICFVLSGEGLSWQDGATYEVRAGDVLAHPPAGAAHTLVAGSDGLEVLMFGERRIAEVSVLPRVGIGWIGAGTWTDVGAPPHPFEREAAAGPVELPPPSARPRSIAAVDAAEPESISRGETAMAVRRIGPRIGCRQTGVRTVAIEPGALGCPPHCHSAEEELFVVLEGEGTLLLGDARREDWTAPAPGDHAVYAGHVISRPAGTGVAHAFRAGPDGLVLLGFGRRDSNDMAWYPRSSKVTMRGLGVTFRVTEVAYWDGEA
ncbi:MAG: hypothetical protein QOH46_1065 [Solirubrobacteraceae bacterium]|nr:hypothetical protein [Solirubrobacteraceae bacterium]